MSRAGRPQGEDRRAQAEGTPMDAAVLSRRALLQTGCAALVIGLRLEDAAAQGGGADFAPNASVRIDAGGTVHVSSSQTEMGQGTLTGIAMIVADELDADWQRVRVHTLRPDGKRFMITGGSGAIQGAWEPARLAGAQARAMLLQAGAAALGAAAADCRTERHAVVHAASGRRIDYKELVAAAARLPVPEKPALKDDAKLALVGQPLAAKNLAAIVRGEERYGMDLRVPGMLIAVIERSPVVNGRLARFDASAARKVPGVVDVVVVRGNLFPTTVYVRDGVAVVARNTWAALEGRKALKVEWNEANSERPARAGALASSTRLAQDFERVLADFDEDRRAGLHKRVTAVRRGSEAGMAEAFKAPGTKTVELTFDVPLFAHAPMEPMNAIARWQPERLEVWAPTHFQSALHAVLRHLSGLAAEQVVIHTPTLGGSFGRRLEPDYAVEAALVSRELKGAPVQVVWTRADDLQHGFFGPPTRHRVRAALGADGRLAAVDHAVAGLSVRLQTEPGSVAHNGLDETIGYDAVKFPYAVEHHHVSHRIVEQTIRVLWWRRGFTPNNTFANEVLLDACAHAAGADPLAYRQALLLPARTVEYSLEGDAEKVDTGRLARVQRLACEAAGWGQPLPAGAGRGLASTVTQTYCAQVVEVAPRPGGGLRVARVTTAIDCGRVVNPQLARAQIEGCVAFALSAALKRAITVEKGRVQQSNFTDYPLLRIDEMPAIETVFVPSTEAPSGLGEPASHPTWAALSNAVFAASGQRPTALPFKLDA
jgi:isoquinoline 1-oxidoreductase subunit beta